MKAPVEAAQRADRSPVGGRPEAPQPTAVVREAGPGVRSPASAPLCDLILLSWNHLEETTPCLESLFATTRVPCRLIIVDNGSDRPVREFLAAVAPQGAIREVALIQNERNEGFPRGMNQGLAASQAPYVCLLNNDLRFTTGWLEELVCVLETHPEVGLVNPTSNTFGNRPPRGMVLEAYARQLQRDRGLYTEVGMCIGFCLLIRRAVLEHIGALSEEVERIFFEDEDFSMRAQQAGFRCAVALASYVQHAEHRTVRTMPEREALFARNQRWCHARWGRWVRLAWPRREPVVPGTEDLRQWLTRLVAWSRRRVHVYVWCPLPAGVSSDALFRSVGLVPYADVHWHSIPAGRAGGVVTLTGLLKRQKKRFDVIIAPDRRWAGLLRRLRWVHRAEVMVAGEEGRLQALWERACGQRR
jgi:GT2 family glycosyltransferase